MIDWKALWNKWNELFLFPIAIFVFVAIWVLAANYFGEDVLSAGLQPLGYYLGPLFFRPALWILGGIMATQGITLTFPGLLDHTLKFMKKVLNPAFQAWGTEKREENLKMDQLWALVGLVTYLWLYTLAVFALVVATV